jgi:hypothetical protein
MSKVRMYLVTSRNGRGEEWNNTVAAHSKETAMSYFYHEHVSTNADFLGFYEVEIHYGASGINFRVADFSFESESPSYNYLTEYMSADIEAFIRVLKDNGSYP